MSCSLFVPQEGDYNADDDQEEMAYAKKHNVSWCMRGPLASEGKKFWKNQRMRPNGRFANRGGFRQKQKDVFKASGRDPFFHPQSLNGLLVFLCIANVCTCMLTTESKDAVTTAIEIPRVHMHASVLCAVPSPTRNECVCCCSSCFASWLSEH